jgi:hypothetical protein
MRSTAPSTQAKAASCAPGRLLLGAVRERLPDGSILPANKRPSLYPSIPAGLSDRGSLMPGRRSIVSTGARDPHQVLYAAFATLNSAGHVALPPHFEAHYPTGLALFDKFWPTI